MDIRKAHRYFIYHYDYSGGNSFCIAILPSGKRRDEIYKLANLMFAEDFPDRILAFDQKAAISFAEIASQRRKSGQPISQADAQIAAICYRNNATLATRNVKDFVNCNINIINPFTMEN